ncbi:P22 phage major capsid protein family protein [Microcella sp.]|uniref:P22 phage major capsid protein family protein n=1 Tax=Microcella sp. TaxID=1913979 RepID=UPI00391A2ECC
MAITNFLPTMWSAAILERFNTANVLIPGLNSEYEGILAAGNTVKITSVNTPTIVDYAAASRTITPAQMTDTTQSLVINNEKAFSFIVDDIDAVQAAGSFDAVTRDAGAALAEDAEATVIAALKAGGTSAGTGAIATADAAYAAIIAIRQALVKANVPTTGRVLVCSPEAASLLLGTGSKLTSFDPVGDEPVRNGVIGRLLGFTVVEHPQLTHTSNRPAMIGYHANSVAYVGQIQKLESGRMETKFADYIRGLNVFGTKVLRATAVQTYLPAS